MAKLNVSCRLLGCCLAFSGGESIAESLPSAVSHVYYVNGGVTVSGAINESSIDPILGFEISAAARVGVFLPWVTAGGHIGGDVLGYVEAGTWALVNIGAGYGFIEGGGEPYLFVGAPIPVRLGVWRRNWLVTAQPYARIQLTEGRPNEAGVMWKLALPMF